MKSLCSALPKLILASQSPARKRILEDEGINVIVLPTHTDETISTPCPQERVRLLSLRKLQTFLSQHEIIDQTLSDDLHRHSLDFLSHLLSA